jgi:hypothetical protein
MILGDAARALVKDLVCSLVVHPPRLPLSLRLSNPNASAEIMQDAARVLNQAGLFGADSRNNEVVADVMLRPLRDGRKRMPRPPPAAAEVYARRGGILRFHRVLVKDPSLPVSAEPPRPAFQAPT